MQKIMNDLVNKAQFTEHKALKDFEQSDWTFNRDQREWIHKHGMLKFPLERNELGTQQVLKDKIVAFFVRS